MIRRLRHKFLDALPEGGLDEGIIYLSLNRREAVHLCPCGCGERVFTPLSLDKSRASNEYSFAFYEGVSLEPAITNQHLKCRSSYLIHRGEVFEDHARVVEAADV